MSILKISNPKPIPSPRLPTCFSPGDCFLHSTTSTIINHPQLGFIIRHIHIYIYIPISIYVYIYMGYILFWESPRMALLQSSAISSSAVLAALCRCLQWPSALRRCLRLRPQSEGGLDAALGSCELADAPGQWPSALLGKKEEKPGGGMLLRVRYQ